MTRVKSIGVVIIAFIAASETSNAAFFSIDLTQVSVGINGGFPNVVGGGFNNVTSPFQNSVSRTLQQSTAQAAYNFVWTPDVGDFSINSAMSCQGPISQSPFQCSSSGSITLTTLSAVTVQSDIGLNWTMPAGDREATIDLNILDLPLTGTPILSRACGAGAFGPPSGSCAFSDSALLSAGRQYKIAYSINFVNYSGSPTVLSTGNSAITLHLEPAVPEPSSLGPLALAAMFILRRSRH